MREQNIEVTVVSGQPQPLKVNVHQTVEHLVHEALQKSGNQGQAPSEWELRTEDGRLLEQSGTVAAAAIHDGMTLGPFIATRSSCTRCCVTSRPSGSRAHARLLGIDRQGREILTFIEGEVYVSPEEEDRPAEILSDAKVVSAARLIRRFHDATAGT